MSNDERIKSFLTYNDWKDELYEANEQRWFVDRKKFNKEQIIEAYVSIFSKSKSIDCFSLI